MSSHTACGDDSAAFGPRVGFPKLVGEIEDALCLLPPLFADKGLTAFRADVRYRAGEVVSAMHAERRDGTVRIASHHPLKFVNVDGHS